MTDLTASQIRARSVCREMLLERKYKICHSDTNTIIARSSSTLVYVYFIDENLSIKIAKEYFLLITTHDIKHCIIVYDGTLTPAARNAFTAFHTTRLELFAIDELQFNITRHDLVPTHERVPTDGINCKDFPVIKPTDPVAKFYGYQVGDLIRITRKDGSVSYRTVR